MLNKRTKICLTLLFTVLLLWMIYLSATFIFLPSQSDYQQLIENAEAVEIQYLPLTNYPRHIKMLDISGEDKDTLIKLASIIEFRSFWSFRSPKTGSTYRIKVTCQDGTVENIDIRWPGILRHGYWWIRISNESKQTIQRIVSENNGKLPDKDAVIQLMTQ